MNRQPQNPVFRNNPENFLSLMKKLHHFAQQVWIEDTLLYCFLFLPFTVMPLSDYSCTLDKDI